LLRHLVEVEHIAAEPQNGFALQKNVCEARRDIEAPGNKLLLTAYGDFVLPEARCLSKSVTKVVSRYIYIFSMSCWQNSSVFFSSFLPRSVVLYARFPLYLSLFM